MLQAFIRLPVVHRHAQHVQVAKRLYRVVRSLICARYVRVARSLTLEVHIVKVLHLALLPCQARVKHKRVLKEDLRALGLVIALFALLRHMLIERG